MGIVKKFFDILLMWLFIITLSVMTAGVAIASIIMIVGMFVDPKPLYFILYAVISMYCVVVRKIAVRGELRFFADSSQWEGEVKIVIYSYLVMRYAVPLCWAYAKFADRHLYKCLVTVDGELDINDFTRKLNGSYLVMDGAEGEDQYIVVFKNKECATEASLEFGGSIIEVTEI